ncbi:response regulator transcription factor [Microbacterium sp. NPDC089695]|uniref:response regulator transcription factor n=1 Tax=Microbacterium sp. NPDC089695 TaxID=3364198 RepID=UPI00380F8536
MTESAALPDALASWWLSRSREVARTWFGGGQIGLFAAIDRELVLLDALVAECDRDADPQRDAAALESIALLWPHWAAGGRILPVLARMRALSARVGTSAAIGDAARLAQQQAGWAYAWLALCTDDVVAADWGIELLRASMSVDPSASEAAKLAQITGIRALHAGDADLARERLHAALEHHQGGEDADVFVDLSFLAAADSVAGDQEAAFDHCERAIALCDERGERWIRTYVVWAFALSAWRDGNRHRAFVLALDGAEAAADVGDEYACALCVEVAGWYECVEGDMRRGARLLGAADALRATSTMPLHFWGTGAQHADAIEHASRRLGRGLLEKELETGHALGIIEASRSLFVPVVEQIDSSGIHPPPTPRQREIASLIAEGRSNKEIARLLLITVRTVESHIEHLFERLDVSSRAQVAAWSVREAMRRS